MIEKFVLQEAADKVQVPIPNGSIVLSAVYVCAVAITLFYVGRLTLRTAFKSN